MKEQVLVELEDLYNAYIDCKKNKSNKYSTKKFELNALYNLTILQKELNNRTYKLRPSQCFIVDYPSPREIFCANFRDRIVQHFVYNELNPIIEKELIYDTCNCRVNKGNDFGVKRVARFLRQSTLNYTTEAYYLKLDLSGFFMNIDKHILLDKINNLINTKYTGKYKDVLLYLVKIIILSDVTKDAVFMCDKSKWDNLPKRKTLFNNANGMPIGNICSQLFANYYLNELDHYLKDNFKYVSRYVDDIIVIDREKEKLVNVVPKVEYILNNLNLKINQDKTTIKNCKYGIHYLGCVIYPHYISIDIRRVNRLYYSSRTCKDNYELFKSINSRRGSFIHYKGRNILIRWYESLDNNIKEELEMNIEDLKFTYKGKEVN